MWNYYYGNHYADVTQLARVTAFQAVGCAFESRRPLQYKYFMNMI